MSRISSGQAGRKASVRSPATPRAEPPAPIESEPTDEDSPQISVGNRMRVIFYLALGLWLIIGAIVAVFAD